MNESELLPRKRCQEIMLAVQAAAYRHGVEDIEILLTSSNDSLTRFANNAIEQNVSERSTAISVRASDRWPHGARLHQPPASRRHQRSGRRSDRTDSRQRAGGRFASAVRRLGTVAMVRAGRKRRQTAHPRTAPGESPKQSRLWKHRARSPRASTRPRRTSRRC